MKVPGGSNGVLERSVVKNNKGRKGGFGKGRESFTLEVVSKTKKSSQIPQHQVNGLPGLLKRQSDQSTLLAAHVQSATSTSGQKAPLLSHLSSASSSSSNSLPSILLSEETTHPGLQLSHNSSPKKTSPQDALAGTPGTSPSSSNILPPTPPDQSLTLAFVKSKPNSPLSSKALGKQVLRMSEDKSGEGAKEAEVEVIEKPLSKEGQNGTVPNVVSLNKSANSLGDLEAHLVENFQFRETPAAAITKIEKIKKIKKIKKINFPSGLPQPGIQLQSLGEKRKIGRPLKSDHELKNPRRKKKVRLEGPVEKLGLWPVTLIKGIIVDRPPPLPLSLFAHNPHYLPYSLIPQVLPSIKPSASLSSPIQSLPSSPPPILPPPVTIQHLSPSTYLPSITHRRTNRLFTQAPLACATALPASLFSNPIKKKHKRTLSTSTASPEELDYSARVRAWENIFRELIPLSFEDEYEDSDSDECNSLEEERSSVYMAGAVPLKNTRWKLQGIEVGAGWVRNGGNFPGGVGRWVAADWRSKDTRSQGATEQGEAKEDGNGEKILEADGGAEQEPVRQAERADGIEDDASHQLLLSEGGDVEMSELSSEGIEFDELDED